ncbi:MAG: methyltransferase domain-containing protein [Oscillospiraceae bacterium]|jgi:ubiquinone/menaquinone biosynthesis C-methylase UbiE|nr:methyltransferase domain-containing protein [Oscillospiraceae bacterium]
MRNTERFTGKATAYDAGRPEYPAEALDCLAQQCGLAPGSVVADIGAGTGKLTRLLLARGYQVAAVEPGGDMRETLLAQLRDDPGLRVISASAEATGLPDHSVDAITVATAFHWFDKTACKTEFARILKPGGKAALFWNIRDKDISLTREHGELMKKYRVREEVRLENPHKVYAEFFSEHEIFRFRCAQAMDEAALLALTFSRSYSPAPGDPRYAQLERAVKKLFAKYQKDGAVEYCYRSAVVIGSFEKEA